MSPFTSKKALIIGATSGIGWGLAEKFVSEGIDVVIAGRREDRLKKFVDQHGGSYEVLDLSNLAEIPHFIERVFAGHPNIDTVILNSGIQRGSNFTKPETVDLATIGEELTVNYISYIHFTKAVLPFLLEKEKASLIFVGSLVGIVPMAKCISYCATKAALHQFVLSLRNQLKGTAVEVLEIIPPAVQTELHLQTQQPDLKSEDQYLGMPLEEFIEETWVDLSKGNDLNEFPIGFAKQVYASIEPHRQTIMNQFPQDV